MIFFDRIELLTKGVAFHHAGMFSCKICRFEQAALLKLLFLLISSGFRT